MTTVAVDLNRMVMMSDTLCTGGLPNFPTDKIFVAPDGTLIGIAGDLADCLIFVRWYQAGAEPKDCPVYADDAEVEVLTLNKSGCHHWTRRCQPVIARAKFTGIGSGGLIAKTAMHLGKSLEEALIIAAELDNSTAGPFVSKAYVEIKPAKPSKEIKPTRRIKK